MAIVKETTKVFFQGINFELIKGNEVKDSSPLVKARPELFEVASKEIRTRKAPAKKVETVEKVEEIKLEEKVEAPKEELLIEEPVAELKVTEVEEEKVEEEKPKRRRRKS